MAARARVVVTAAKLHLFLIVDDKMPPFLASKAWPMLYVVILRRVEVSYLDIIIFDRLAVFSNPRRAELSWKRCNFAAP